MLLNLYKKKWNHGLKNMTCDDMEKDNRNNLNEMKRLSKEYKNWITKENESTIA